MSEQIEVRIAGRGVVAGDEVTEDTGVEVTCALCGGAAEAVASVGGASTFACADCLRARLEAMSIARFRLREPGASGLPWGKVSG